MKKKLRFSREKLKALRESKGMSKTKLAEFSGLNRSEIWKLEAGYNQPRTETLLKVAEGLGVKIQELLEEETTP